MSEDRLPYGQPDPVFAADQMAAGWTTLAHPAAAFYAALRKEGLSERQALHLAGEWVRAVVQMPPQDQEHRER